MNNDGMMDVEITGLEDVERIFEEMAPREAINLMRATVHSIAGVIKNFAKDKYTPIGEGTDGGTLLKAIKTKRERAKGDLVSSTVIVSKIAFYWRFLEYGLGPGGVEYAMFHKALADFEANREQIIIDEFWKKLIAKMAREAKRTAANGN